MSKLVIELQKDIIENKTDTISILRKAKLIATKLNLIDFKQWIDYELNGYENYVLISILFTNYININNQNKIGSSLK